MRAYRAATVAVAMMVMVGSGSGAAAAHSAGWTSRVTVSVTGGQANAYSDPPVISADGRYVAFGSYASNLVAGDTNEHIDVFVRDLRTGVTSRESVTGSGGQANGESRAPSISADGRYVAFQSSATNLPGGFNRAGSVFLRDRVAGTTVRVVPPAPDGAADGMMGVPLISADGRYVALTTYQVLEPGDTNGTADVYVWERQTGAMVRVSVTASGGQANDDVYLSSISADGRYVAFVSGANLAPGDISPHQDLYVRDRQAGTTTRLVMSATSEISGARMSPDGRYFAFHTPATDLVPRDPAAATGFACFVHDRATGTTSLVSISPTGAEFGEGCFDPVISADGRWVAFSSFTDTFHEVYLRDRRAGTTVVVSVSTAGAAGDGESSRPAITADGRVIAFSSRATTLVRGDAEANYEIFLRDYRR